MWHRLTCSCRLVRHMLVLLCELRQADLLVHCLHGHLYCAVLNAFNSAHLHVMLSKSNSKSNPYVVCLLVHRIIVKPDLILFDVNAIARTRKPLAPASDFLGRPSCSSLDAAGVVVLPTFNAT
jgi:hypothetical protein